MARWTCGKHLFYELRWAEVLWVNEPQWRCSKGWMIRKGSEEEEMCNRDSRVSWEQRSGRKKVKSHKGTKAWYVCRNVPSRMHTTNTVRTRQLARMDGSGLGRSLGKIILNVTILRCMIIFISIFFLKLQLMQLSLEEICQLSGEKVSCNKTNVTCSWVN